MSKAPAQYPHVSNRDITIVSLHGYAIEFKKGVATHVPKIMHGEVMEKGILPCDEKGDTLDIKDVQDPDPKAVLAVAPDDQAERNEKITPALRALAERNARGDFSAGGVPTSAAVTQVVGWKVEPSEIRPLWTLIKQEMNAQA